MSPSFLPAPRRSARTGPGRTARAPSAAPGDRAPPSVRREGGARRQHGRRQRGVPGFRADALRREHPTIACAPPRRRSGREPRLQSIATSIIRGFRGRDARYRPRKKVEQAGATSTLKHMLRKLLAARTVDRHNPFRFAQFERGEQRDIIRAGGGRDSGRGGDRLHRLPPCWCGSSAYQVKAAVHPHRIFFRALHALTATMNFRRSAKECTRPTTFRLLKSAVFRSLPFWRPASVGARFPCPRSSPLKQVRAP